MDAKPVRCPSCGKSTSGEFCSHCGASLTGRAATKPWAIQIMVPWIALGMATVALVVSLLAWFDRGDSSTVQPAPLRFSQSLSTPFPDTGQPPDLSSMSPREAADRLFNRVMTASENGNTEEAQRFMPMALQAYDRVGTLDNDARYHVALLHLTAGDMKSVRAQIDKLRKSAPHHLFGYMLEREMAERSGKQDGVARANKAFLAAYDAEMASGRMEYQEHRGNIERFRVAAQASKAGKQ